MASKPGALYAFPWESWGNAKYAVLLPFVAAVALGADDADSWAWHMLVLCALRYAHAAAWNTLARLHAVSAGTRITAKPVEFKQVDREDNWDDYILLQVLVMSLVHNTPRLGFGGWPAWNGAGLVQLALLHAGPTELLYYWLHRALHWHPLYQRYHSHHHASFVAEPITGACAAGARRGGPASPAGLCSRVCGSRACQRRRRRSRARARPPRARAAAGASHAAGRPGALARGWIRCALPGAPRWPRGASHPSRALFCFFFFFFARARLGAPVRGAPGVHRQLRHPAAGHLGGRRRVVEHVLHLLAGF
jgi:hypothetical protein